ncbi:hypothetical protein [uncultured Sphingomonas sp.]|uniref:hypothetical protein n=1 Tax=uncultured Sphingomonas sp. TaxID=158754 RepID=UPI0025E1D1E9|nr:hypothetical protein [uncultured Sphingomonas sp.]
MNLSPARGVSAPVLFFIVASGLAPVELQAQQAPAGASGQDRDQIIVVGRRPAEESAQAEDSLSAADIVTFGADRVADVIARLRDYHGGNGFSIIVNGRRLGGIDDILELPPEALAKIEILPAQSGGGYGVGAERKVLNLVLRQHFHSVIGEASAGTSTDGGAETVTGDARYANLEGERRINASLNVRHAGSLRWTDRFSLASDPTFSNRSLVPATDSASGTVGFARPLGSMNINMTMRVGIQASSQFGGLARTGTGSGSVGILRQDSRSTTAQSGATLGGSAGKLSWSVDGRVELGSSTLSTVVQPLPDPRQAGAGGVPLLADPTAFPKRASTTARYAISGMVGGSFLRLPAGWASFNMTADASADHATQNAAGAVMGDDPQSRRTWSWRTNVSAPLVRRGDGPLGFLGDVSGSASMGYAHTSRLRSAPSYDASLNWALLPSLTLGFGTVRATTFPGASQLYAPLVRQSGVLLFDPVTNTTVAPIRLLGGNAGLQRQLDTSSTIRANFQKRIGTARASAGVNYSRQRTGDPVISVNGPGTALEEAFPERFVRDATGNLLTVDMRPLNGVRRERKSLLSDLHLSGELKGHRAEGDPQSRAPSAMLGGTHWELGLSHSWLLSESLLLRAGRSPIDLLAAPLSSSGQLPSRHTVQARAGLGSARFTAQFSGNWRQGTSGTLRQGDGETLRLHYSALLTMDGQVTLNIGHRSGQDEESAGLRIKVGVTNLLNARPRVQADGAALPFALHPRNLDPVGRTLQLGLRKRF